MTNGGTKIMKMTMTEIKEILQFCIDKKILRIKVQDLEADISPLAWVAPDEKEVTHGTLTEDERLERLSDDDPEKILYLKKKEDAEEDSNLYHSAGD